jgi:hypothetical protein
MSGLGFRVSDRTIRTTIGHELRTFKNEIESPLTPYQIRHGAEKCDRIKYAEECIKAENISVKYTKPDSGFSSDDGKGRGVSVTFDQGFDKVFYFTPVERAVECIVSDIKDVMVCEAIKKSEECSRPIKGSTKAVILFSHTDTVIKNDLTSPLWTVTIKYTIDVAIL